MLKAFFTIFFVLLLSGCVSTGELAPDRPDIYVKARLASVDRRAACGILFAGSVAYYDVLEGPESLRGKSIRVLVGCIEMPMASFRGTGDLTSFDVGATHFLILSERNVHQIESPSELLGTMWYYLKAASLKEVRPNNSFKPKPLRGSA